MYNIVEDISILISRIDKQGRVVKKTIEAGLNSSNAELIINSSRGIIFSKNPRKETKKLRDEINRYRK